MEWISQMAAVVGVLVLLAGTLWWLRVKGFAGVPGPGRKPGRHLQAVERLPLSPQHSLHAVRFGEHLLLIAVSPAGCTLLEQVKPFETALSAEVHR